MGWMSSLRARVASAVAPPASPVSGGGGGWSPLVVREPYTGAWQLNAELTPQAALTNAAVFRCVSLIAGDVAKTPIRLVAQDDDGVWSETTSPAFSPVLRTPNRYQTIGQFLESWMWSKLLHGNTYVLKDRDDRGVVRALYVLDALRVMPLVAPDGAIYYQVSVDLLAGLPDGAIGIPAADIIHDRWNCAFHPLIGLSPLYACGAAAAVGNAIQTASGQFFSAGGRPSGVLMAPTEIDDQTAQRVSAKWHALGPGKTAVVGSGMKYQDIGGNAVDAQLTEQYNTTVATIAGCFGVPVSYVDASKQPPYANSEATQLQYHAQCLQVHMTAVENALDAGLELPDPYGTEFDYDALIWMDTASRTKAAHDAIMSGAVAPNEARKTWFGLGPVPGGSTPYLQQQMFSLAALAQRDAADPFATPAPAPAAKPADPGATDTPTDEQVAAAVGDLAHA